MSRLKCMALFHTRQQRNLYRFNSDVIHVLQLGKTCKIFLYTKMSILWIGSRALGYTCDIKVSLITLTFPCDNHNNIVVLIYNYKNHMVTRSMAFLPGAFYSSVAEHPNKRLKFTDLTFGKKHLVFFQSFPATFKESLQKPSRDKIYFHLQ